MRFLLLRSMCPPRLLIEVTWEGLDRGGEIRLWQSRVWLLLDQQVDSCPKESLGLDLHRHFFF
jgi:hypothetical protein